MSARILNAQGILSSDVPTGNLVWVDAVNGIDALAVRGRMTIPFKTLTAAKTAAVSGDTIIVLPGTYNENNLAKNGINWHFLTGAIIEYSGTGSALFDTSGGACTFKVTGDGVFKTTHTSGGVRAFSLANNGDVATLRFDRIEARGQAVYSAGALTATGHEAKSTAGTAIEFRGASENLLNIARIEAQGGNGVYIGGDTANCIVRLHAHCIVSSVGYTLYFTAGTAYVDAFEVSTSGGGAAIQYGCASNHPLHLRVSRIVNTLNDTGARAIVISSGSGTGNGAVRLYGSALFSKYGDYAISAGSASDVLCPQWCVVKAKSGGSGSSNVTARIHTFLDVTGNANVGDL